jgi:hypothetical protein
MAASSYAGEYWPSGNGSELCKPGFGGGESSSNATATLPKRKKNGKFLFEGQPLFCPNVAPWEVIQVRLLLRCVIRYTSS